jgi:hypothetical protein
MKLMSEGNVKVNCNATVNPKAFGPGMRKRLVSSGWFLSTGEWCQSVIRVSTAIGVSMTVSVKQVWFNRLQQSHQIASGNAKVYEDIAAPRY